MNPIYEIPTSDPRVKAAVSWLQNRGALGTVELTDESTIGPFVYPYHLVTFRTDHSVYTAIAGLLALYPYVSLQEMTALGMIAPQTPIQIR